MLTPPQLPRGNRGLLGKGGIARQGGGAKSEEENSFFLLDFVSLFLSQTHVVHISHHNLRVDLCIVRHSILATMLTPYLGVNFFISLAATILKPGLINLEAFLG